MKFISLCFVALSFSAFSQNYWQQEVNYEINVKLDDKKHELNGDIEFLYINNSPNELKSIYIHLWPNAYKGRNSALAKQQYKDGKDLLYYGPDSIKGGIDSLAFTIDNVAVKYENYLGHEDVVQIKLPKPLVAGGRITVQTPFRVKIPSGDISRLGHVGQSYQITQWYPKPAVYDKNGWHPIPYLNQGEFYSEFGSFDVKITLPANYTVGSTGDLKSAAEIKRLEMLAAKGAEFVANPIDSLMKNDFPESSLDMKTVHYRQSRVHDFGWFADKRFMVLQGEVELPHSKRKVASYAMFTPKNAKKWSNAIEYINDGTYYYSLWNGDYPYNHVTAVDGTISAGGGMEYPNVTVIGNAGSKEELEIVIVHEVGHNWFYGILGTNERDHGWMDEGLNTLNEIRYIQTKYPGNTRLSDMVLNGKFHMDDLDYHDQADFMVGIISRLAEDQPVETKSPDFTSINYGLIMYQKTGLIFHYMKSYLGDSLFDECMSQYFQTWKFKHPQPEDLKTIFEKNTGKSMDWFFTDLIQTTNRIDYKITSVKSKNGQTIVGVRNAGQVNGPIPVTVWIGQTEVTKWLDPSESRSGELYFEGEAHEVIIDPTNHIPEIDRSNNYWHEKGLFGRIEPLKLEFLTGDNEARKNNFFWMPAYAYNRGDRHMFGAVFHNYSALAPQLLFHAVPMYSVERQSVSGLGDLNYSLFPKHFSVQTKIGTGARTFKTSQGDANRGNYYWALTPYVQFKFRNRYKDTPWGAALRLNYLSREDAEGQITKYKTKGGQVALHIDYSGKDFKWNNSIYNEYAQSPLAGKEVLRTRVSSTMSFRYLRNKQQKWVELRLFGGNNWIHNNGNIADQSYRLALSGANGSQDLFFEDVSFNRANSFGNARSQRMENMGGFKSVSGYGNTAYWMTTANLYLELPYISIIGLYTDAGLFFDGANVNTTYDMGVGIRVRKMFRVYFPILMEQNLNNSLSGLNYMQKIRFSVHMNIFSRPIETKTLF